MAQIREERANGNGKSVAVAGLATEKQLKFLDKLGVDIPSGLTKKQASELIDEAKERESEQDSFPQHAQQNVMTPWYSVSWV